MPLQVRVAFCSTERDQYTPSTSLHRIKACMHTRRSTLHESQATFGVQNALMGINGASARECILPWYGDDSPSLYEP